MPAILVFSNHTTMKMKDTTSLLPGRFIQQVRGDAHISQSAGPVADPGVVTDIALGVDQTLTPIGPGSTVNRIFLLQVGDLDKDGPLEFRVTLREPPASDNILFFTFSRKEPITPGVILIQAQFAVDSAIYALSRAGDITTTFDSLAEFGAGNIFL